MLLRGIFAAAHAADVVLFSFPCGRRLKDAVLDTILGRQEPFEYVSRTTPGHAQPPR